LSTKQTPSKYEKMNQLLRQVHVERFGDPEKRENEWEEKDVEMEESEDYYKTYNSILRQAFLQRHTVFEHE
jgi:hypothetical protein